MTRPNKKQSITKCSSNKGFSGNSSILPRETLVRFERGEVRNPLRNHILTVSQNNEKL